MKITLEDAEAWYRGDPEAKVSAHEAATFYRFEMVKFRDEAERLQNGFSVIEKAKWWAYGRAEPEARQILCQLEETELRVKSREEEMNRSLHNVRILAEDFRKMARPVDDLHRLFAWPIAFMDWIGRKR